jgi:hypothetical protein
MKLYMIELYYHLRFIQHKSWHCRVAIAVHMRACAPLRLGAPDDSRTCLMTRFSVDAGGSDVFEVGGYEWKLEMYPYGDSQVATFLLACLLAEGPSAPR